MWGNRPIQTSQHFSRSYIPTEGSPLPQGVLATEIYKPQRGEGRRKSTQLSPET